MSEQKAWQPSTMQVETAAMALRAQQMRLWNLVEESRDGRTLLESDTCMAAL
ncbi:hypothetical protein [Bifidobacterium breve]|uniref:hypothetical protein n=1 Tax=Bifidobacterium breve TaxID=1685 RepID=UPI003CFD3CC1